MKPFPLLRTQRIAQKKVLVRVDFDVPMDGDVILDDTRIQTNIPTLKKLLADGNTLILIAKRGRPQGRDMKFSLQPLADILPTYIPGTTCMLIPDFLTEATNTWMSQTQNQIYVLENIRFYSDDECSKSAFQKMLASLADVYVNDAFAMAHRDEFDIVGLPSLLPGYAGLSLEKEVTALQHVLTRPERPRIAIVGGAKMESKIEPIKKLMDLCDAILLGGGIANTFLKAHGYEIEDSLFDTHEIKHAQELISYAQSRPVQLVLPIDVRIGDPRDSECSSDTFSIQNIPPHSHILDIGPATQDIYEQHIALARTIIWNGPMGLFEYPAFKHGTDAVYRAIIHNRHAYSLVGGGDTLGALARKHQIHDIDHLCAGGGAMLDFIQYGDLPALEALRTSSSHRS